nr:BREX system P-loop protein BrxC [Actinomycetota bacterium]
LQGSPTLARIQDRFALRVELSDKDVEQVIRSLVLRKKPQMQPALAQTLEKVSGEANKHLISTKIGARPGDAQDLIPDYPILPVRRRFWEHVLRAIDRGGGSGQLRTQLRVSHDANQHVADNDLGNVVGADFIFFNQASGLLSGKVISQNMYQRIKAYEDGTDSGELKARVLGLVFLIAQLPTEPGADQGLRPRPDTLAELLVSDLRIGSAQFQRNVEESLTALVLDGAVVEVEGEYPLQTPEGAELQRLFQDRLGQIRNDTLRVTQERDNELRHAVENAIGRPRINQGASKTPRFGALSFGFESPDVTGKDVPVWVRDGWSVANSEFRSLAQKAGTSDPTVFVFLPRENHERIRDLIASYHAARDVLDATPSPDTPEGHQALSGLDARQRSSRTQLDQLMGELLASATVWQAGGTEISEGSIAASTLKAIDASLIRKFPKFREADHDKWGTVVDRAREGNQNPLDIVGHTGDVETHPVCKAVLSFLAAGKKGSEVHNHFGGGEYGWPDDAINGALLTLVAAGVARAQDKHGKLVSVKDIRQPDIKGTTFIPESIVVGATERIAVRKLLTDCGVSVTNGQELEGVSRLLQRLLELGAGASGPPPLPEPRETTLISQMQQLTGNALITRAFAERDSVKLLFQELSQLSGAAAPRMTQWQVVKRLLAHAAGLGFSFEPSAAISTIEARRQLLANPDPVQPIVESITNEIRTRLQKAHADLESTTNEAIAHAGQLPSWSIVGDSEARSVLARHGLSTPSLPKLGSPTDVLAALDINPLADWKNRIDAIPARLAAVQAELAQLAQPEAEVRRIKLPSRVLKSADDIDAYVAEVRQLLRAALIDNTTHLSI